MIYPQMWSLLLLLCLLANAAAVPASRRRRQQAFSLVASTPFRMIVSPTSEKLETRALRALQSATADHLLYYSTVESHHILGSLKSVEIVIQQAELQAELSATGIKFFALATIHFDTNDDKIGSQELQAGLDDLIEASFATSSHLAVFVHQIHQRGELVDSVQAQDIKSVVIAPVVHSTGEVSSPKQDVKGRRGLSTLDIVLIVVSMLILLGICWMVLVHYVDAGYYESQRQQVLNNSSFANSAFQPSAPQGANHADEESTATDYISKDDCLHPYDMKEVNVYLQNEADTSSLQSSPSTGEGSITPNFSFPVPNRMDMQSTGSVGRNATADGALPGLDRLREEFRQSANMESNSFNDSSSDIQSLTESFGDNWFRSPPSTGGEAGEQHPINSNTCSETLFNGSTRVDTLNGEDEEVDSGSNDPFHVDFEAVDAGSASPKSEAAAVSQWMSSIHVVPNSISTTSTTTFSNRTPEYESSSSLAEDSGSSKSTSVITRSNSDNNSSSSLPDYSNSNSSPLEADFDASSLDHDSLEAECDDSSLGSSDFDSALSHIDSTISVDGTEDSKRI